MKCGPEANKFGEFLVKHLHDETVEYFDRLAVGKWKSPATQPLQNELAKLSPKQRELVRRCILQSLRSGMHQFLFALGEAHDFNRGIAVVVDGVNIAEQSDGLQGEMFGDDGWLAKYSKHHDGQA